MRSLVTTFCRAVSEGSVLMLMVSACADQLPTAASPVPVPGPRSIEYSDGFYPGGDGYYFWDGQAPPGDLSPAIIQNAMAGGMAPRFGTAGWVSGEMETDGDQYRFGLRYTLNHNGQPYYSNAEANSDWKWGGGGPRQADSPLTWYDFKRTLDINPPDPLDRCGYSLQNGGNAFARKAVPFGINLNWIKPSVALTFGTITWGANEAPLIAFTDDGQQCDELADRACDRPDTPQYEPCPVAGDPAYTPPNYGGGESQITDVRGEYGGYSSPGYVTGGARCVEWIDWFGSWDGGRTWKYLGRDCEQWEA